MTVQKPTINWSKGTIDWHLPENRDETTFLVVGDILLDRSFIGIPPRLANSELGSLLFSNMRQFSRDADIVMGNLENPLSDRGSPIFKYGPNFRASPSMAKALRKAGFTVLGVANNHARDYGDLAFLDTLNCLRSEEIYTVGGGRDRSSAVKPLIVRKHGMSIGFLAFTYRQESVARARQPGTADLDDPNCYSLVKAFSEKVDFSIVYLHLDGEYSNYPAPYRMSTARRFIDLGAGMVIGVHPHVPQGIEIYKGRLITYSLGNFIFKPHRKRPLTGLGYALRAELTQNGPSSAAILPYRINHVSELNQRCQPTPLSNTDHQGFMTHLKTISAGLADIDHVRHDWEQLAIRDAIAVSSYVLKGIIKGEPHSLWSSRFTIIKRRLPVALRRLVTGKILGDVKSLLVERIQS